MKIRIKGNSLRFRLTKSEINLLGTNSSLEEKIEFGDNQLIYCLQKSDAVKELQATYIENKITVSVPTGMAANWINTELVGLQNNYDVNHQKNLFILIEKDFVCLDNTLEDQSDNFENPNGVC